MANKFLNYAKKIVPKSLLYGWFRNSSLGLIFWKIFSSSQSNTVVKSSHIKNLQKKYNVSVFIETGTYLGDTVWEVKEYFKKIYSIELDEFLCKTAQKRFSSFKYVQILQGDSAKILPQIISEIAEPCLFWLDAHFSGGITTRTDLDTPIMEELKEIKNHPFKNHVILIDDADEFTGSNGYPDMKFLTDFVKTINNNYEVKVMDNIIQILP